MDLARLKKRRPWSGIRSSIPSCRNMPQRRT